MTDCDLQEEIAKNLVEETELDPAAEMARLQEVFAGSVTFSEQGGRFKAVTTEDCAFRLGIPASISSPHWKDISELMAEAERKIGC